MEQSITKVLQKHGEDVIESGELEDLHQNIAMFAVGITRVILCISIMITLLGLSVAGFAGNAI